MRVPCTRITPFTVFLPSPYKGGGAEGLLMRSISQTGVGVFISVQSPAGAPAVAGGAALA